jgi:hypothetical protein
VFIVYPFVSCTISPFNPIISIPTSFATQISQHPLIYPYPILFLSLLLSFPFPFCRAKKPYKDQNIYFSLPFIFSLSSVFHFSAIGVKNMDVGFGLNSPPYYVN